MFVRHHGRALYVVVNGSPSAVLWKSIFCSSCQCVSGCVHGGAFGVYLSQNKVRRRVEENLPQNGRKITRPFSGFIFYLGVGVFVSVFLCVFAHTVIIAIFGHVR